MIFIAHRGESYDAPENTLAAINLAWQRDADAVEVDVHLSKDDKIVVIHDDNTGKFDGKFRKIKDQTLEELRCHDVGKIKGSQWLNERIPTLEQVLDTVPENKYLFIEIKCGSEILTELKNLIDKSNLLHDKVKLIGFDFDVMKKARKIFDRFEISWVKNIEYLEMMKSWQPVLAKIIAKTQQANLDGLDFSAGRIIDKTFVDLIKTAGLKLYVWNVDDPSDAKRLIDAGIDGITTNCPQWLKGQLGY
jgi:glycerophosphoryl diester phosphodiesterase